MLAQLLQVQVSMPGPQTSPTCTEPYDSEGESENDFAVGIRLPSHNLMYTNGVLSQLNNVLAHPPSVSTGVTVRSVVRACEYRTRIARAPRAVSEQPLVEACVL